MDWVEDKVEQIITSRIDRLVDSITYKLTGVYIGLVDIVFSVFAIALVGYILYICIRIMFFSKEEDLQQIIFGYFLLLIIRIFNTILIFKFQ